MEADRESYGTYRAEVHSQIMGPSVRTTAAVISFLNVVFIAFDYWVYPQIFPFLLSSRLALFVVMGVVFWGARRAPRLMGLITPSSTGVMLLAMIAVSGGVTSDYSTSLMLLLLGFQVLLPLTALEVGLVAGAVFAVYAALPLLPGLEVGWRDYVVHACFPLSAALASTASAALLDRIRFTDFRRRREVEQARDKLQELDQEKSRFTANVHHELRTPLTLMLAPLDAMIGGEFGPVPELQRDYLKTMHKNARRLLKLINNLLDLAKIEGEQLTIRRAPIRVGPLVDELLEGARPLADRKGVVLESRGLDALPELNVDAEALEKVIVNLVGNALKFTDRGGRIDVIAEPSADGGAHLVVADTGVGIPEEQLARVFDRFAQVDSSGTRRHEGTGIGLSLARELIELHGGRVWAESEGPGRGSQMHLQLPFGEPDADPNEDVIETASGQVLSLGGSIEAFEGELDFGERPREEGVMVQLEQTVERAEFAERAAADAGTGQPKDADAPEVLVVEDNADMRRLLAYLVGQEFWVRTASNGREGLERVRESPPELVLTDVMMPEMSGTELCRAIKEDPATRHIPVVLVTSKAEREMKVHGLELGADDYVTKPFHPRELMARVRSLVRLRRLQEELKQRNVTLEETNDELGRTLSELQEAHVHLVQSERLAAVGEIAAGVAHEVNNPVNFATNALKTLRSYVDDVRHVASRVAQLDLADAGRREEQLAELGKLREELEFEEVADSLAELAAIVTEGLERTHRLVGDLRDFAAPGDGPRAEVDLRRGIESTLQLIAHELRNANVQARLECAEIRPQVRGDARALNQVFLNLLKNAAEALEGRGGSVLVRIRRDGEWLAVEVQDDGPGIPAELQPRLFQPFFTTKGAGKGTGLGLSISRRIVDEHGGTIAVESAPGEGTCFTVRIPAQEEGRAT